MFVALNVSLHSKLGALFVRARHARQKSLARQTLRCGFAMLAARQQQKSRLSALLVESAALPWHLSRRPIVGRRAAVWRANSQLGSALSDYCFAYLQRNYDLLPRSLAPNSSVRQTLLIRREVLAVTRTDICGFATLGAARKSFVARATPKSIKLAPNKEAPREESQKLTKLLSSKIFSQTRRKSN